MIIGITGGIGSGKSTVARELAKQGFAVYDCDAEAKRIVSEDRDVQRAIVDLLGAEAFKSYIVNDQIENIYNTAYVAQRVFAEPDLRQRLNAIIHPAVIRDISLRHEVVSPLFVESAILYEAGFDTLCEAIVEVEAPEAIRLARTIDRDYHGIASPENIEKVRARMRAQREARGKREELRAKRMSILNDGQKPVEELATEIVHKLIQQ